MPELRTAEFCFDKGFYDTHFVIFNEFCCGVVDSIAQIIVADRKKQLYTHCYIRMNPNVERRVCI